MHLGDHEPDVSALLTTLSAISDHPDRFSYGAISIAARTAADVIRRSNAVPSDYESIQCEGQLSIHDVEAP